MGTSKGYIAPTKPEWRAAKRAVSEYIRSGDSDSRAKAVSRFAEAALLGQLELQIVPLFQPPVMY